ncbi:MAG: hypothetical protein M8353_02940 [ANME-2 cluster archaeon]|nr:hypothetical protein [ANME-2 cluster archaeon]
MTNDLRKLSEWLKEYNVTSIAMESFRVFHILFSYQICELIQVFLAERGLELSESKTLITHINDGFDFLGWSFRKYDGTLLIKPSKGSIKKITDKIREIIHRAAAWTMEQHPIYQSPSISLSVRCSGNSLLKEKRTQII